MGTYAKNNAPVGASGPFCLKTLRGSQKEGKYKEGENEPKMISSNQALETGTQVGVTIVLAQFDLEDNQMDRIKGYIYCILFDSGDHSHRPDLQIGDLLCEYPDTLLSLEKPWEKDAFTARLEDLQSYSLGEV